MNRWIMLSLLALTLSPARGEEGFSCVLLGKAGTTVLVKGAPESLPLRLSDCSDVTATSSGVTMCFVGKDGRRNCAELPTNISVKKTGISGAGGAQQKMAPTVMLLLRGDVQTRPGLTRASGPIQGFPTGTFFLEGDELLFPISGDSRVSNATKLSLRFAGSQAAPGYLASRNAEGFAVPNEILTRGAAYVWTVESPAGTFTGRFSVAGDEFAELLRALRAVESDERQSPAARAYLKAELFEQYGLPFNRDRELAAVRAELNMN